MKTIFTIGHSKHPIAQFLVLLQQHEIKTVVDVRSRPYSRFSPQFNKSRLEEALATAGIEYLYLGNELGGKPEDERFYDPEGYVRYDRVAEAPAFRDGIERLIQISRQQRTAIMCAEEDPNQCHRRLLVTPELVARGTRVRHIRKDGTAVTEEALRKAEGGSSAQESLSLDAPRRSPKPVRSKK